MTDHRITLPNNGRTLGEISQSAIDRIDYQSQQNVVLSRICNHLLMRLYSDRDTIRIDKDKLGLGMVLVESYEDAYIISKSPGGS